jgi:hypothetical protein
MPASRAIMEATDDVGAQANTVPFKELDIFRRYMGTAARANPARVILPASTTSRTRLMIVSFMVGAHNHIVM